MKLSIIIILIIMINNECVAEVSTGRYTSVVSKPKINQLSPFFEKVNLRFPSSISTVGKAISVVIAPTGYSLISSAYMNDTSKQIMAQSLPVNHKRFSNVSRYDVIKALVSDTLLFVTDPIFKRISFDLKPSEDQYFDVSIEEELLLKNVPTKSAVSSIEKLVVIDSNLKTAKYLDKHDKLQVGLLANDTVNKVATPTNKSISQKSDLKQADKIDNSTQEQQYFSFKKGKFIADNINRLAQKLGYKKPVLLGFPSKCDWQVPYDYSIDYNVVDSHELFSSMLVKKGFGNVKFHEYNKVITATYQGSAALLKSCMTKVQS